MRSIPTKEFIQRKKDGAVLSKTGEKITTPLPYLKTPRKPEEKPVTDPNVEILSAVEKLKKDSDLKSKAIVSIIDNLVKQVKSIKEADPEKKHSAWEFDLIRGEDKLLTRIRVKAIE